MADSPKCFPTRVDVCSEALGPTASLSCQGCDKFGWLCPPTWSTLDLIDRPDKPLSPRCYHGLNLRPTPSRNSSSLQFPQSLTTHCAISHLLLTPVPQYTTVNLEAEASGNSTKCTVAEEPVISTRRRRTARELQRTSKPTWPRPPRHAHNQHRLPAHHKITHTWAAAAQATGTNPLSWQRRAVSRNLPTRRRHRQLRSPRSARRGTQRVRKCRLRGRGEEERAILCGGVRIWRRRRRRMRMRRGGRKLLARRWRGMLKLCWQSRRVCCWGGRWRGEYNMCTCQIHACRRSSTGP